jgi:hypothetical protein
VPIQTNTGIFYAIDFDRCLSDTDRLDELFYQLVEEHSGLDVQRLKTLRNTTESKGASFDQITELQKGLSPEELNVFFESFITEGQQHDLLSYGAQDFLRALDEKRIPYGIVSYGHPDWQLVKIKTSGLAAIPSLIIDHSHKGEVVASWQQANRAFLIPASLTVTNISMEVESVVLLDDKAVAFDMLPNEAHGYWVQSVTRELLPSQQGSIPENVIIAHGFDEVRALEFL